jgi:hypothetical protein
MVRILPINGRYGFFPLGGSLPWSIMQETSFKNSRISRVSRFKMGDSPTEDSPERFYSSNTLGGLDSGPFNGMVLANNPCAPLPVV